MPENNNIAGSDGTAGTGNDKNVNPEGQTLNPTPKKDQTAPPEVKTFTEEEVNQRVLKAREDEKTKVFGKIDEQKDALQKAQDRAKQLEENLKTTQKDLDDVRTGKASEIDSVNRELSETKEQIAKLEKTIESVGDVAAQRVHESEMKAYRAEAIRKAKVVMPDLVAGSTKEEIDASIVAVKEKESKMEEALREKVRAETAANLPKPLSPDGTQGRGPTPVLTHKHRESTARLPKSEYEAERQKIMAEAIAKVDGN